MARYAGLWLKSSTLGSPSHLENAVEFGLGCLEAVRNSSLNFHRVVFSFLYFQFVMTVVELQPLQSQAALLFFGKCGDVRHGPMPCQD